MKIFFLCAAGLAAVWLLSFSENLFDSESSRIRARADLVTAAASARVLESQSAAIVGLAENAFISMAVCLAGSIGGIVFLATRRRPARETRIFILSRENINCIALIAEAMDDEEKIKISHNSK